jgi:hypothetical protein
MAGIMNVNFGSNPCPPANSLNGFDVEEDLSGTPINVRADGLTDLVFTTFQAGNMSQAPGWLGSTCPAGNYGDNDLHCGVANGGIGETNFDDFGLGQNQWGGFVENGLGTGADANNEGQVIWGGYNESTVQMLLDSGTGNGIEEGRCTYDYDCPAAANVGQLSARVYSFQNIGQRALVIGSLSLKPACANLKGAKLAVNIDIVTSLLLKFWSFSPASSIIKLTDNGAVPAVGLPDGFKDGTADMLIAGVFALPLPAQVVPLNVTINAFFQGFVKKTGNPALENTQATGCAFHG